MIRWPALYAIALRQLYLMRGSPTRVLPIFAWVAVDIVLWGFIARYLARVSDGVPDFTATLLGAVLLWDFFSRVMQGVTTAFLEDVWSRNFLNLFASPLSVGSYLGGLVLTSVLASLIGLAVMLNNASDSANRVPASSPAARSNVTSVETGFPGKPKK